MTRHVPISDLKNRTSEMIAAAEGGEEIAITRHGKVAARLLPPTRVSEEQRRRARQALDRLAEIRAELRSRGMTATVEEMIEWKNEGRR